MGNENRRGVTPELRRQRHESRTSQTFNQFIRELAARGGTLVVTEGVGDHENLGALFRNAAAFGVNGVIIGPGCSDPLYRRSIRVSMGNVLRVPFATADEERSFACALAAMRARGYRIAALTPRPNAMTLPQLRSSSDGPVALLVGSEGHGLSQAALAAADVAGHQHQPAAAGWRVAQHLVLGLGPDVDPLRLADLAGQIGVQTAVLGVLAGVGHVEDGDRRGRAEVEVQVADVVPGHRPVVGEVGARDGAARAPFVGGGEDQHGSHSPVRGFAGAGGV